MFHTQQGGLHAPASTVNISIPVLHIPVSGYTSQISSAQTVMVPCKRYSIYWFHAIPVDFCCVFGDRYREVSLYSAVRWAWSPAANVVHSTLCICTSAEVAPLGVCSLTHVHSRILLRWCAQMCAVGTQGCAAPCLRAAGLVTHERHSIAYRPRNSDFLGLIFSA